MGSHSSSNHQESGSPENPRTIGTLTYTKFGLFTLFAWLLWGEFCFQLMEKVLHALLPLQMQAIGASNQTLGIMNTFLPNCLGLVVGPAVSYQSDRYRSRWGRRIPFIVVTAPFLCIFLASVGFTEDITVFMREWPLLQKWHIEPYTATIVLVGFLILGFAFFNEFVNSVYWYLFADVVPQKYLGRFNALFRVVASISTWFFNFYIFPHAETHAKEIYIGISLLYFFGFGLMCWRVKEGEYPPEETHKEPPSLLGKVKSYINECFSTHPIYFHYYLFHAVWALTAVGGFGLLFNKQIGLSLEQIGKFAGIMSAIHAVLHYPAGMLADKFHPVRLTLFTTVLALPSPFLAYYYKVDWPSYVLIAFLWLPVGEMVGAAEGPMRVRIFPRKRFGQFASANGMLRTIAKMVGAIMLGRYLDQVQDYRAMLFLTGIFHVIATIFLFTTYYYWKKCGGDHYVAPLPHGRDLVREYLNKLSRLFKWLVKVSGLKQLKTFFSRPSKKS